MTCRGMFSPLTAVAAGLLVIAGCERPAPAGEWGSPPSPGRTAASASSARSDDGELGRRSDGELFALLPTQDDFPEDTFVAPSPADSAVALGERKLPETDPVGCSIGNPQGFRASAVTASLASGDASKRTISLAIGKQAAEQGQTQQVKDWIARCGQYSTPPSFGGVDGEETVSVAAQDSPDLGIDQIVSYEQRTQGSVRIAGSDQESDVDERVVTVFGQLRGVFLSASWRDEDDRDLALELLSQLVDRVRAA
jgi:hypothetical protein